MTNKHEFLGAVEETRCRKGIIFSRLASYTIYTLDTSDIHVLVWIIYWILLIEKNSTDDPWCVETCNVRKISVILLSVHLSYFDKATCFMLCSRELEINLGRIKVRKRKVCNFWNYAKTEENGLCENILVDNMALPLSNWSSLAYFISVYHRQICKE